MTAIVTGGSGGIGSAAAIELASRGFGVIVNYHKDKAGADETVRKINASHGSAKAVGADISNPDDVKNLISHAEDFSYPTVLVNNAGISYIGLLQDMSEEDIRRQIEVNLLGAILCSKEISEFMIKRKSGSIVNVASVWGETGASCEAVYSACKAGIIGFTKALAKELGPSGIRVNCVSPGVIDTKMNGELDEEAMAELKESTPLLRIGRPEEVAKAIGFLASSESSFITGVNLSVNGGFFI